MSSIKKKYYKSTVRAGERETPASQAAEGPEKNAFFQVKTPSGAASRQLQPQGRHQMKALYHRNTRSNVEVC